MNHPVEPGTESAPYLYVVTLVTSISPLPLPAFTNPEFAGLAVFRSRRIEDGRERFRIHLGYFESPEEADVILPLVREEFPWAFVGPAPQINLGSLDDTGKARFTIVRPVSAPTRGARTSPAKAPAAKASPEPLPAPAPRPAVKPAVKPVVKPAPAAEPPVLGTADIAMSPASTRRRHTGTGSKPAMHAKVTQRYAIQLIWSTTPIDLAKIPSLAIFGGYLLYAVQTEPGGRRMYGVRLGFYDDALSARLVALYMRPTYKGVVVPVSEREIASASAASIRLADSPAVRGRITPKSTWPPSAVPVAFSPAANPAPPPSA
jgi:hypothetical protein